MTFRVNYVIKETETFRHAMMRHYQRLNINRLFLPLIMRWTKRLNVSLLKMGSSFYLKISYLRIIQMMKVYVWQYVYILFTSEVT